MGEKGGRGLDSEVLDWLTKVPVGDVNFKCALERADAVTIREALKKIEGQPATTTKKKALEAALKKLEKQGLDPVSEAAEQVVEVEQQRGEIARSEQEERERRIAECHQVIGRIQAVGMVGKLATVATLVWLKDVKASGVYLDLPGVETWDKFCESLGKSRRKIDEDLQNLAAFGEDFMATVASMRVGYRDLRKLRQLSHDGTVVIDAEAVLIGEERIPLDGEHKEELQTAIETLVEKQAAMQAEFEAQKKAFDRVQADTHKSVTRLQKDLAKLEKEAAAKGLTPAEDAFCQKCDNARLTIDGFLNQFDPAISPLPEDATPRMKATLMHTLAWFKRCIIASFDTANDVYGEPEMDDEWVPPHLRKAAVEAGTEQKECQLCRSAHPSCDQCCKVCQDQCNIGQICRLEA